MNRKKVDSKSEEKEEEEGTGKQTDTSAAELVEASRLGIKLYNRERHPPIDELVYQDMSPSFLQSQEGYNTTRFCSLLRQRTPVPRTDLEPKPTACRSFPPPSEARRCAYPLFDRN